MRPEYPKRSNGQLKFLVALKFLTVLPLPERREASLKEIGGSTVYFPVVGIIIGLILAGLNWLLRLFLPVPLVTALLLVAIVLINGALHLDGFIDTCDGIAGHKTVEERLKILRDSHVGSFGIVGAILLLLVKYAALSAVPGPLLWVALILMPVISRWTMVYAIFAYPYARRTGLGTIYKQETKWPALLLATMATVLVVVAGLYFFGPMAYIIPSGVVVMGGTWLVTIIVASFLKARLSGLTGDSYGAINETAEVSVLILVSLLLYNQGRWI
ncbi:MAG: adenosylcobinamide-GDP ribazoletransferase [Chloroflexota bacterium]